jgi:hypothetical protein
MLPAQRVRSGWSAGVSPWWVGLAAVGGYRRLFGAVFALAVPRLRTNGTVRSPAPSTGYCCMWSTSWSWRRCCSPPSGGQPAVRGLRPPGVRHPAVVRLLRLRRPARRAGTGHRPAVDELAVLTRRISRAGRQPGERAIPGPASRRQRRRHGGMPTSRVPARAARLHPGVRLRTGKADWLAHGLPTGGEQAQVPRAKDVLRRDVVTARPGEPVGVVAARVAGSRTRLRWWSPRMRRCWVGCARPCWRVTPRHGRSRSWRPAPPPFGPTGPWPSWPSGCRCRRGLGAG